MEHMSCMIHVFKNPGFNRMTFHKVKYFFLFWVFITNNIVFPQEFNQSNEKLNRPNLYLRASLGTALGVASGTIIGGYTAAGIFRTSSTNNPDAGLGNVGIVFFGIYSGATIGAATGTTIALNPKKRLKGFITALLPYVILTPIILQDVLTQPEWQLSNTSKALVGISIVASISLSVESVLRK